MKIAPIKNPTDSQISSIIDRSKHKAAKWIKDLDTGDIYYWEAEKALPLRIANYDKGIAVND